MARRLPFWLLLLALSLLVCHLAAVQDPATPYRYKIAYATYVGGNRWDQAREVIVYSDGSVLVGAQTKSTDMPVTPGVVQPKYAGDDPLLGHGGIYGGDCFLYRLSPDGRRILAATYFGGSKQERNVYGMGLDSAGNVVITSSTRSPDMPTTAGSFQSKFGSADSGLLRAAGPAPGDWFVAKISPDLTRLLWCTYVGGSDGDSPRGGLTVDKQDYVYIAGVTASPDFPTTAGVYQQEARGASDAAIVKLKPDGSLVFSTRLGGSDRDGLMGIQVAPTGNLYVAGHTQSRDFPVTAGAPQPRLGGLSDSYLASLTSDAGKLRYATYLGGKQNEFAEHQLALAPDGSVLLTGSASSPDFPTTKGAYQRKRRGKADGFLAKLSPSGKEFVFSTLLGGSGDDFWLMPTKDRHGNIFLVGQTSSEDLPVTANALQKTYGGGRADGALAVLTPDGSKLLYATYLGGSGGDMIRSLTLGPNGEVYLVGHTGSEDFPVTAHAAQTEYGGSGDTFVAKLVPEK